MVSSCIRPTIGFCARPIPTTTLIATRHAEDSPTLRALAEFPPRPLADSRGVVGVRRGSGSGAWGLPHRQDSAPGVWQAEAHGGIGRTGQTRARAACGVFGAEFLELVAPQTDGLSECIIELEGPRGKMRIQWKGVVAPDLAGLSRALWESA